MKKHFFGRLYIAKILILLFTVVMVVPFVVFAQQETLAETEKMVTDFFAEDPIMISIAKCESGFRQFTTTGDILRASGRYVGIFQIDDIIHASFAKSLGFDIYTAKGNIDYAKYLYKKEGSNPWRNCAKKYIIPTVIDDKPISSDILLSLNSGQCPENLIVSQKMKISDRDGRMSMYAKQTTTQVALLQKHINRILAERYHQPAGPEDGIFGPLTQQGVKRLQTALNDFLDMDKPLVIDGIVGPFTKQAINNSCGTDTNI